MQKYVAWLMILIFLSGCGGFEQTEQIRVAASIPPLTDFVEQVGGEFVEIKTIVPPGASPHTYELRPVQMRFLSRADLLVLNGAGLEYWADDAVESAENPGLKILDTAAGMELLDSKKNDHNGHHRGNPHVWLDPRLARRQVKKITEALVEIAPEHQEYFETNMEEYLYQLEEFDRQARRRIENWKHRRLVVHHAAWNYFVRRYNLEVAGIIEQTHGQEPSASHLQKLIKIIDEYEIPAVFAEHQANRQFAELLAAETGSEVGVIDPLGGATGRQTYLQLMNYNLEELERYLN